MTFPKERLENVVLYPCNISEENQSAVLLSLPLKNYSKLEKDKLYYQRADVFNSKWTLMIVISRETLFVFLSTTTWFSKVYFRIFHGKEFEKKIQPPTIQVIGRCLFAAEICHKTILNLENEYLHDDVLTIQCVVNTNEPDVHGLYTVYCDKPCENDMNEMCKNLLWLYKEGLYSDFIIEMENSKFRVHKAVLAARSQFFGDLFTADNTINSIILKGIRTVMHEVLIYMYSGELKVMDAVEMFEVSKIAEMLQMDVLKERCIHYFDSLVPSNIDNITIEKLAVKTIKICCEENGMNK